MMYKPLFAACSRLADHCHPMSDCTWGGGQNPLHTVTLSGNALCGGDIKVFCPCGLHARVFVVDGPVLVITKPTCEMPEPHCRNNPAATVSHFCPLESLPENSFNGALLI